jgi:uncharacterized membrane protein YcaP (DUF421 family)
MFFDNWHDLLRVAVVGISGYSALILLLRLSGKRTLSKWNAFDLIVTIALGSTLATLLLSRQVSYTEGVLALALLIGLQYLIARLATHFRVARRLFKSEPRMLYRENEFLDDTLRRERVTRSEVRAAVRGAGIGALEDVEAVVLETDGSVSVIAKSRAGTCSALSDVQGS